MLKFPAPLLPGDLIAVPAPSSGVTGKHVARLELAIAHLRSRGYRVIEGGNLRSQHKDASAAASLRAEELRQFLHDPEVAAIIPPWGGELASEILELLDFQSLRQARPKWMLGYSDISTLLLPITLLAGWASAHGTNLMEMTPGNTDPLASGALAILEAPLGTPITQHASSLHQTHWQNFAANPQAGFKLTEPTAWKRLDGSPEPLLLRGRLIGGCLDTLASLAGTPFGKLPAFIEAHRQEGVILYLENAELSPPALVRTLLSLRRQGWFTGLAGLMFGRNAAPGNESAEHLSHTEALQSVCATLPCPVLYDMDIGHQPPQLTLINGALAEIRFAERAGTLTQTAGR
jgi:muramoyltetrapeptide carboxypeptidase